MALETERKFLVDGHQLKGVVWPVPVHDSHILQRFLIPEDPSVSSERIRIRIFDVGPVSYTHTRKTRVSAGVHEEEEQEVTPEAFYRLSRRADPAMTLLSKDRRVFAWEGHTFELDTFYDAFRGLVVMEVELGSLEEPVVLPPFIPVLRELTHDSAFTNAGLARMGYWRP